MVITVELNRRVQKKLATNDTLYVHLQTKVNKKSTRSMPKLVFTTYYSSLSVTFFKISFCQVSAETIQLEIADESVVYATQLEPITNDPSIRMEKLKKEKGAVKRESCHPIRISKYNCSGVDMNDSLENAIDTNNKSLKKPITIHKCSLSIWNQKFTQWLIQSATV